MKSFVFFGKTIPVSEEIEDAIQAYLAYATLSPDQLAVIDRYCNRLSNAHSDLKEAIFEAYMAQTSNLTDDAWHALYEQLEEAWDEALIDDNVELVGY